MENGTNTTTYEALPESWCMTAEWRKRSIATGIYALVAGAVAWVNRESLYYLDAGVKFACFAAVPLVCLLGLYWWHRAYPNAGGRWKRGLAISFTVIISLATVWLAVSALLISFSAGMTPSQNVRKYAYIVGKWHSPLTAHFPRPIPSDARAVRFYYDPGALQAVTTLELGYTTTPERIETLYRTYARCSTLHFTAGTENGVIEPVNYLADDMQGVTDFSGDYTLFYLDEKPPIDGKTWDTANHGVAISTKRCRVVFWAASE